jgi:hypothetical protein
MKYVERLIRDLQDDTRRVDLVDVEDALRLARMRNYSALSAKLNEEGVTKAESRRLRNAVFEASRSNFDPGRRYALLLICMRDGDRRVREEVEAEAARLLITIREAGDALYGALIALQDSVAEVFPSSVTGTAIDEYDTNVRAAWTYLGRRGLFGRRIQNFYRRHRVMPANKELRRTITLRRSARAGTRR